MFDPLTKLEHLYLNQTGLTALPQGVFDSLTALRTLNLHTNQLALLQEGVFDSLRVLQYLHLNSNQLGTLPEGAFDSLTALETLDLSSNRLEPDMLPDRIFEPLTNLGTLRLSGQIGVSANFAPVAVAGPDDAKVSIDGGTVTLDSTGSGGLWGTNVTYLWKLRQTQGRDGDVRRCRQRHAASHDTGVIALPAGTKQLIFRLIVSGRGDADGPDNPNEDADDIVAGKDDVTVTVNTVPCGRGRRGQRGRGHGVCVLGGGLQLHRR